MASILLIDDDETFRTTLAQTLTAGGHVVTTASDGLDGARLFRARPTDLIITDMMMPHGGLAVIRVLREQFHHLRIIAMTGGGSHRLDYARSLGASRTLAKPFTPEQLASAIAGALAAAPSRADGSAGLPPACD